MHVDEIQLRIRSLIARIGRIDEGFRANADVFRELGVESAAALDLLLQLEEEFGVSIRDEAFAEARTLDKMTALVAGLRGAAA